MSPPLVFAPPTALKHHEEERRRLAGTSAVTHGEERRRLAGQRWPGVSPGEGRKQRPASGRPPPLVSAPPLSPSGRRPAVRNSDASANLRLYLANGLSVG